VKRLLIFVILVVTLLLVPAVAAADVVTFTGGAGTNDWNTAGNWSPPRIPTQTDDVTIPGGKTVTNKPGQGLGAGIINSITLRGTLTIDTSGLTLMAASTINNLTLTSASQYSQLTMNGSTMFKGKLVLSPGVVNGSGAATITGPVIASNGSSLGPASVDNQGPITVTPGSSQVTLGNISFTNDTTGSIALQGDGIIVRGNGSFTNSGSIAKSMGTGSSTFSPGSPFSNSGTVAAQSGTLQLLIVGTSTGTFNASSGATLQFANVVTLNAGTTFGGSGTMDISAGGVWDVEAPVAVNTTNLAFDGGEATMIRGNSDLTINSVTVTWSSGTISGAASSKVTLSKAVKMQIVTNGSHALQRNLDLFGTVNLNAVSPGGDLQLSPSVVTIEEGATFDIQTDNSIHGEGTIDNGGTFKKTGGTQTSTVDYSGSFNIVRNADNILGTGTVAVNFGTLDIAAVVGGALAGTMTVSAGATLEFGAGTYSLAKGTAFQGAGNTLLALANWTLNGDAAVNTTFFGFDGEGFDAGVIGGSGKLTVTSRNFIWIGGWMEGTGSTTISAGTKLTINTGQPALIGWTIDNLGTTAITDSSSALTMGDAMWNNHAGATFDFQSDGSLLDNGNGRSTFTNDGTVQKTQGTGTSMVFFSGTFNNNGKVIAEGGGELLLATSEGTSIGAWIAKGQSEISFDLFNGTGGDWTINKGTTMSGGGTIRLAATWILATALVVQSEIYRVDRGDVQGNFDFSIESPRVIMDGMSFSGHFQKNRRHPASGCGLTIPSATTLVQVQGLTLNTCAVDNFASVQITGSSGSLSLNSGSVLLNEASGKITLDMPTGSQLSAIAGDGSSTVTNSGSITLGTDSGASTTQTISTQGTFSNSGNISVPAKRTLDLSSLTQTGGATSVATGSTLAASGTLTISGGTIGGNGTISGPTNNTGGTIEAGGGNVTGKLALNAAETQGAGSSMTALISGTMAGVQYDQINNTSSDALNGTLNLQFGNGFTPTPTDTFNILNFSSVTGNFATVNAPPGWTAQLKFTGTALNVQFSQNGLRVSINPKTAMVKVNGTTQFTGTMVGGSRNGETWRVKESGGGTVTQTGLYTAPATAGTYHVVVTSVADATKADTATVTVTPLGADKLTVTPQAALLQPGAILRLHANQSVAWSVAEGPVGGSVAASGSYTAPRHPGLYHVVATGAEGSNRAVANIAVTRGKLESAYVANLDKNSVSVLAGVTSDDLTIGPLQETESLVAGQGPVGLAISPDGKLLLSANQNSNDISVFAILHGDGARSVLRGNSFAAGTQPSSVAFDPAGPFVFVTNQGSDDVSVFSVDASDQLIFLRSYVFPAGAKPSAIAVHPDGSAVYVTNAGTNTVHGFACDAAGMLRPFSGPPSATGTNPAAAVIDSAGKYLFVANRGSGEVSAFAIDVKNETLQEVKGSPFKTGEGAAAIAIDLTGSYLFVADHQANDIASLQIDSETGALTLLGHTPLVNAGPSALAVDPSGQYLHVTSDKAGGMTTLKLDVVTGTLAPAGETTARERASSIVLGRSTAASQGR
jgi:6-phosphogluconolactonase (cycloisomerase 2 family)